VGPPQSALGAKVPGARTEFKQLQTNPVEQPIQILLSNQADVAAGQQTQNQIPKCALASRVEDILREVPTAARVHNDWGEETTSVRLTIDPDRANLAGITNSDVAYSASSALGGMKVTTLREEDKRIPIVVRLRPAERAQLSDVQNLYVYSGHGTQELPLVQISSVQGDVNSCV